MRGFSADPDLARGRRRSGSSSGPGCSTGATASRTLRRTTIILYGIVGGARRWSPPASSSTTRTGLPVIVPLAAASAVAGSGCSCWPARRRRRSGCWPTSPSAFPTTAARSWASTRVFLAIGQIVGSLIGGFAADRRGIDGHARRDVRPAARGARSRWPACARRSTTRGLRDARRAHRRRSAVARADARSCPVPLARGRHGAVVAPHHLATAAGLAILRAGGSRSRRGDRDERRARRRPAVAAAGSAATRSG